MTTDPTKLLSPVTHSKNVRKVATFSVPTIVELYSQQEHVDVAPYFKGLETIDLLECGDTSYRYYYPQTTAGGPEFYTMLGESNEDRGLDYDRDWDEDHQFGYAQISPGERVLEIGCNTGKFLKRVTAVTEHVVGLDFTPTALEKARARGVEALNESMEDHAARRPESYDVICAFQVFEHLTSPGDVMRGMIAALRPGGKIVLSVPNNEPYFQRFNKYEVMNMPPHHMGLWNLEAFERMAEHYGLDVIEHKYYGSRGVLADAYLRAKHLAGVISIPTRHSFADKTKIMALAPFALGLSSVDFGLLGKRNHGNIAVVLKKNR